MYNTQARISAKITSRKVSPNEENNPEIITSFFSAFVKSIFNDGKFLICELDSFEHDCREVLANALTNYYFRYMPILYVVFRTEDNKDINIKVEIRFNKIRLTKRQLLFLNSFFRLFVYNHIMHFEFEEDKIIFIGESLTESITKEYLIAATSFLISIYSCFDTINKRKKVKNKKDDDDKNEIFYEEELITKRKILNTYRYLCANKTNVIDLFLALELFFSNGIFRNNYYIQDTVTSEIKPYINGIHSFIQTFISPSGDFKFKQKSNIFIQKEQISYLINFYRIKDCFKEFLDEIKRECDEKIVDYQQQRYYEIINEILNMVSEHEKGDKK